jgi:Zn-dependent metalloprotease
MLTRFLLLLAPVALLAQSAVPLPPAEIARLRANEPARLAFIETQLSAARFRLGLAADDALALQGTHLDRYGTLHARYRQTWRGVRILGAGVTAHLDAQDRFLEPTAKLFTGLTVDVVPQTSDAAARAAVLATVTQPPAPPLESELVILPERALVFTDDPTRRVLANVPGFDEYSWTTTAWRLAWYVRSAGHRDAADGREPQAWIVDAGNGSVIRRPSLRADDRTPASITARTLFHGEVTIDAARDTETGTYELVDPTRGNIRVLNLNRGVSFHPSFAAPFRSSAAAWGDGARFDNANETTSANGQTAAADVAFTIARAWDYLASAHGHDGLDGRGSPIEARVHFGTSISEAFWHRSAQAAFFGDGAAGSPSPTDLETVAHELGHGLWFAQIESEGGLDSEADAIGQGSADIFASLVEFHHRGDVVADWNFRERMVNPAGFLSGPDGAVPQPGLSYWNVNVPALDEHAAGTLYGHLFALLVRGASASPASPMFSRFFPNGTAGIGVQAAADLWYLATTAYLPPEPTFAELRAAWMRAAETLYGAGGNPIAAAVANAFAAAGMGLPAADLIPPSLTSLTIEELNEGEASMLVSAGATDDTGIIGFEFLIDNRRAVSLPRPPYRAWIDIAGLAAGRYTLTARAIDNGNKVGFTTVPFVVAGVNQLISGGGFEGDVSRWTASAGVFAGSDSFLGTRHAAFAGNATLAQTVAIPNGATAADLSFRLRVDNAGTGTGARLELQIRDDKGSVIATPGIWFDNLDTRDPLANNYRRRTVDLSAWRGRTVEIRFVSAAPDSAVRFRIDNISAVATGSASVETRVEVDEREGSIDFRLDKLNGVRPDQISRADYVAGDEVVASSSAPPFRAVRELQGFAPRAHTAIVRLYDLAGAKILESAPAAFRVEQVNQLLRNGGFEAGLQNWLRTGAASVVVDTPTVKRSFLGSRAASLAGRGVAGTSGLSRFVEIPASATEVKLTFRLRVDTQEPGPADAFLARISEQSGQRPRDLLRVRSDFSTRGEEAVNGYIKRVYDISEYAGSIVNLYFEGREDAIRPTAFLLDNVALVWK